MKNLHGIVVTQTLLGGLTIYSTVRTVYIYQKLWKLVGSEQSW